MPINWLDEVLIWFFLLRGGLKAVGKEPKQLRRRLVGRGGGIKHLAGWYDDIRIKLLLPPYASQAGPAED
jgi:hypothetical protein